MGNEIYEISIIYIYKKYNMKSNSNQEQNQHPTNKRFALEIQSNQLIWGKM